MDIKSCESCGVLFSEAILRKLEEERGIDYSRESKYFREYDSFYHCICPNCKESNQYQL
jgi:hypothetical protein